MANKLRTITFEDGTQYAVNAPVYEISGELTEESNIIDFGALPEGLTEIKVVTKGVSGATGDYYHLVFNGTKTGFISGGAIYTGVLAHTFQKIGDLWWADGGLGNAVYHAMSALSNIENLTTFAIQGYDTTKFAAGTKYALEGR